MTAPEESSISIVWQGELAPTYGDPVALIQLEEMRARSTFWFGAAIVTVVAFLGIVKLQYLGRQRHWATAQSSSPAEGLSVFRAKGCSHCHAVNGVGGSPRAPDLGRIRPVRSSLAQLVTAMWNHAPEMWLRMRADHVPYPELEKEDVAQLLTYIYMARHIDEPGDVARGRQLFRTKHCALCHEGRNRGLGDDFATVHIAPNAMAWTQAMWNNAGAMQASLRAAGLQWPQFTGQELNDLFAYVASRSAGPSPGQASVVGDPQRGWDVFQEKSCIACHDVKASTFRLGPSLAPSQELPPTFTQVAELMIDAYPEMRRTMSEQAITPPQFVNNELTDVIAFLYSLRYVEPSGSPIIGRSVFTWRGCSKCHGEEAEGTGHGPGLRGRGKQFTAIALATALWEHGNRMYAHARNSGIGWPILQESDVGHLLAFLNTPLGASGPQPNSRPKIIRRRIF